MSKGFISSNSPNIEFARSRTQSHWVEAGQNGQFFANRPIVGGRRKTPKAGFLIITIRYRFCVCHVSQSSDKGCMRYFAPYFGLMRSAKA
jgi:hypothetical protein